MSILAYIIVAVICISMFFVNKEKKFMLLFVNYICFTAVTLPGVPFGNCVYFVPICFFFSEFKNIYVNYRLLSPQIRKMIFLMIVATIILQINSPHYSNSLFHTVRLIISELISKYFVLAYAFISIKRIVDFKYIVGSVYYALLILTFFGFINFITKDALFLNSLGISGTNVDDRFRVQAMFTNSFCYGYICILLLLFFIYIRDKKLLSSRKYFISLICCSFGILICGSRSVLLIAVVSCFFYFILTKKLSKKIYSLFFLFVLFFISYSFFPSIKEKIDGTLTVFTDVSGDKVGGSNLQMRYVQYETTLFYIKDSPFFGKGMDFFILDLGWGERDENGNLIKSELAGLEGVVMSLLLERGIVGLIFYAIFYTSILLSFVKLRNSDKKTSYLGLSVLLSYFLFANSNGELISVGPTLLLCGALLHILESKKENEQIKNKFNID